MKRQFVPEATLPPRPTLPALAVATPAAPASPSVTVSIQGCHGHGPPNRPSQGHSIWRSIQAPDPCMVRPISVEVRRSNIFEQVTLGIADCNQMKAFKFSKKTSHISYWDARLWRNLVSEYARQSNTGSNTEKKPVKFLRLSLTNLLGYMFS